MKASPADQARLLEVQADDARLDAIAHRRRTLPVLADIARLSGEIGALAGRLGEASTRAGDLSRAASKAEGDTATVRARLDRNNARLASGQGSAKDLQAMSQENTNLDRRIGVLEEAELEVMEQLEEARSAQAELAATRDGLVAELDRATEQRDAAQADLDDDAARVRPHRDALAAQLPADLLASYERKRRSSGGVGAAALVDGRCGGCRLQLNVSELNAIRAAPADEVLECDECGRILVRA